MLAVALESLVKLVGFVSVGAFALFVLEPGDVPLQAVLTGGYPFEYAVIEFDHYEGDTFAGIAESYAYLRRILG